MFQAAPDPDGACDSLEPNPSVIAGTVTPFGNISPDRAHDLAQAAAHHGCAVGYKAGYNTAIQVGNDIIKKQNAAIREKTEAQFPSALIFCFGFLAAFIIRALVHWLWRTEAKAKAQYMSASK